LQSNDSKRNEDELLSLFLIPFKAINKGFEGNKT